MIYCFDLDGTLCTNNNGIYGEATPLLSSIEMVRNLHAAGHTIIIFTARGTVTGKDWSDLTRAQLAGWGVPYDRLLFGKPEADIFVDDKALRPEQVGGNRDNRR